MISNIYTIALSGLSATLIEVQTCLALGIPKFEIVGLPDIAIKESKERITFAIKNSEIQFPSMKIIVNLSPADVKKEGSSYDLPIAIGILQNIGKIKNNVTNNCVFIGELGLDGKIYKVNGALSMCIEAKKYGMKKIILPKENMYEAAFVDGIEILPVENLKQVIEYLNGIQKIEYVPKKVEKLLNLEKDYEYKFEDIYGQENVKRALEISASGNHNCLISGIPGVGKTILSKTISSILPDLSFEEALEITQIYSASGKLKDGEIICTRPFCAPHHTISTSSMIGGGKKPMPGEITLAHFGVLYLDELAEFKKDTLEALREPLQDKRIMINRVNYNLEYPSNFMLIASMNPCPCGYYGSIKKECTCTALQRKKYIEKISGPFLDRIDLKAYAMEIEYEKISKQYKNNGETSKSVKQRVTRAREIQNDRYKNEKINTNSELTSELIQRYCEIDNYSNSLLRQAYDKFNLSIRGYNKILKVARTIADLEETEKINVKHIAEAIQYRCQENENGSRI
ncbi:MAG: YifB family Mg chelatase-like AAA ATPase [Clostridia bacterium]|nr:YifB family Mg chelatase-like AAA ATPase [Clostridia bacterium]